MAGREKDKWILSSLPTFTQSLTGVFINVNIFSGSLKKLGPAEINEVQNNEVRIGNDCISTWRRKVTSYLERFSHHCNFC